MSAQKPAGEQVYMTEKVEICGTCGGPKMVNSGGQNPSSNFTKWGCPECSGTAMNAQDRAEQLRSYGWMAEYGNGISVNIEDDDPKRMLFVVVYEDSHYRVWHVPIQYTEKGGFQICTSGFDFELTKEMYWAYLFVAASTRLDGHVMRMKEKAEHRIDELQAALQRLVHEYDLCDLPEYAAVEDARKLLARKQEVAQ